MEMDHFPVQSHTAPPGKQEVVGVLGWEEQSAVIGSPMPELAALHPGEAPRLPTQITTQWFFSPHPTLRVSNDI